ncbi:MAG TPA: tetratricopeptide repeat protein [Acidimicrobiales bacterium]|nr:tetratricopeptide repeat protein [Acidimicrobiales bacterium]
MPPRQPPRRGGAGGKGRPGPAGGRRADPKPGARQGPKPGAKPSARPGRPARAGERRDGPPGARRGEGTGAPKKPGARSGPPRPERRTERSARGRPSEVEGSNRPKRAPAGKADNPRTKSWGSVAKRGVGKLKPSPAGSASAAWREAAKESDARERGRMGGRRPDWQPDEWIDAGPVRDEARDAVGRGRAPEPAPARRERARRGLPDDVRGEVAREAGPAWAGRVQDRLQEAAKAYERERYRDALKLLKPLSERAPGSAAIRELLGLTLYRMGRWRAAVKELEVAELLSGSVDHHPVIADAQRALGRHAEVARLWDELRRGGAGVEVLVEGRIVLAGSLADQGKVREAVTVLEQGPVNVRKPKDHHLRLWYALAAMYERAGEVPRARQLFGRVLDADPDFADVADRYDALS